MPGSVGASDADQRIDTSTGGGAVSESDTGTTSDDAVDEALTRLVGLEDQPLRVHVAVFDAVHGALQDRLADAEA